MQVAGEHSVKCVYGHHCLGRVGRSCQMPNQMSRLSTPFTEYVQSRRRHRAKVDRTTPKP